MSKLRQRIRDSARPRGRSLGFAVARSEGPTGPAPLVVAAEVGDATTASRAIEAGARALLYVGDLGGLPPVVEAAGTTPVGARIDAATEHDASTLADAGADFLIFDAAQTAAAALLDRRLGHVLVAPGSADDDELRRLGPLDVDAVLVNSPAGELSVSDQLGLRRVAELVRAPLALATDRAVPASTLEIWRDAGGAVVVVAAAAIDELPSIVTGAREVRPPRQREEDQAQPLLPSVGAAAHEHEEEEDLGS